MHLDFNVLRVDWLWGVTPHPRSVHDPWDRSRKYRAITHKLKESPSWSRRYFEPRLFFKKNLLKNPKRLPKKNSQCSKYRRRPDDTVFHFMILGNDELEIKTLRLKVSAQPRTRKRTEERTGNARPQHVHWVRIAAWNKRGHYIEHVLMQQAKMSECMFLYVLLRVTLK